MDKYISPEIEIIIFSDVAMDVVSTSDGKEPQDGFIIPREG